MIETYGKDSGQVGSYILYNKSSKAGQRFKNGKGIARRIAASYNCLCVIKYLGNTPIALSDVKPLREIVIPQIDITNDPFPSIVSCSKKDSILKEMINSVDKESFRSLCKVAFESSMRNSRNRHNFIEDIVDLYLNKWANAKYDFYMLFGNELSISKNIEEKMSPKLMSAHIYRLRSKFPDYSILQEIGIEDFIENTCISDIRGQCDYKRGMKLSKYLSKKLNDPEFDIELSKVLQNRKTVGIVEISINPCDFLTASINKHSWRSCYNIEGGMYSTAPFSLMMDDSTTIAFKHDGQIADYIRSGVEFKWNSKQQRQWVHIDKDSCSIIFNCGYGSPADIFYKTARLMIEDCISTAKKIENNWTIYKEYNIHSHAEYLGNFVYRDPYDSFVVKHDINSSNTIRVKIGTPDMICISCGRKYERRHGSNVLCERCL